MTASLRTAAAPAVQAAVKTEMSCRNGTIAVIFCAANTHKNNANVTLASASNSLLDEERHILYILHILSNITELLSYLATLDELRASYLTLAPN